MKDKVQLTVLLALFLPILLYAQDFSPASEQPAADEKIHTEAQPQRLSMSVSFGTMFLYSRTFGSNFGTYFSPRLNYQVAPRLSVYSGLMVNTFTAPAVFSMAETPQHGINSTLIYAGGSYRLSDNVTVSGTVFREASPYLRESPNFNSRSMEYKGFMMGVDLQLGENFFIQGQIGVSEGIHPYWPGYQSRPGFFDNPAQNRRIR